MISAERLAAVAQNRNPDYLRERVIDAANVGATYQAIATDTGLTKGVVAGIVYRARQKGLVTLEVRREPRHTAAVIPKPTPAPRLVAAPPPSRSASPGINIMQLRDDTCRWPLWGMHARPDQKFYCGDAALPGRPYCVACIALSVPRPSAEARAAA